MIQFTFTNRDTEEYKIEWFVIHADLEDLRAKNTSF